jgi:hypothetical protein
MEPGDHLRCRALGPPRVGQLEGPPRRHDAGRARRERGAAARHPARPLDAVRLPGCPLDVLAQQVATEVAAEPPAEAARFDASRRAVSSRGLPGANLEQVSRGPSARVPSPPPGGRPPPANAQAQPALHPLGPAALLPPPLLSHSAGFSPRCGEDRAGLERSPQDEGRVGAERRVGDGASSRRPQVPLVELELELRPIQGLEVVR